MNKNELCRVKVVAVDMDWPPDGEATVTLNVAIQGDDNILVVENLVMMEGCTAQIERNVSETTAPPGTRVTFIPVELKDYLDLNTKWRKS